MNTRQKEIVEVVFRLIAEVGIQELTMKRIASEIGITEPAIYRHFNSKFDVLSAVVDEILSIQLGIYQTAEKNSEDPQRFISAFFEGHARLFEKQPAMTAILFSEDLFRNSPPLSAKIASMMQNAVDRVAGKIRKGVQDQIFRPNADDRMVSYLLLGGFRLLVSTWHLGGKQFSLLEYTRRLIGTTLELLVRP